jgi:ribonuclease HI
VIKEIPISERGYVSPIFTVPKKDGSLRMILNLKRFNLNVEYKHFKMDTLESAVNLMTPRCFMASVDLRHAYYTVAMDESDQRFLQFEYRGMLFQYTCLPMGFASSPRIFTKLCKPVYSMLRTKGHIVVAYIDDSYLQGDSSEECQLNVKDTIKLFTELGFVINFDKSVLLPSQTVEFLGFELNSVDMTVRVTARKREKIVKICKDIRKKSHVTIRQMASLIGKLVSASNGAEFGPLFFKGIEIEKNKALKMQAGNFDMNMMVTKETKDCLTWWIDNLDSQVRYISHVDHELVMFSDASNEGWGAVLEEKCANGRWSESERDWHINVLELMAILYGLKSLCKNVSEKHIRVMSDNTTAVHYITNMGGVRSVQCQAVTREIWLWCMERHIWLSCAYIKGKTNVVADKLSREFEERTEWMLKKEVFGEIVQIWGKPEEIGRASCRERV